MYTGGEDETVKTWDIRYVHLLGSLVSISSVLHGRQLAHVPWKYDFSKRAAKELGLDEGWTLKTLQ